MYQNIDFIILGGGLAGCALALELIQRDATLLLIDTPLAGAASPIAAGIANPVSGKRLTVEPELNEKQSALRAFSLALEQLSGHKVLSELPQTRYLNAEQSQNLTKLRTQTRFQQLAIENIPTLGNTAESLAIGNTYRLDIAKTCKLVRNILDLNNSRSITKFDYNELILGDDGIRWRKHKAKKIIFCEGWRGIHNPWFNTLPFNLNKGQIVKLRYPQSQPNLNNWGQWELHTGTERWLGATTERDYQLLEPDPNGRAALLESLTHASEHYAINLTSPQETEVIQQFAGVRPATIDRNPFIGLHLLHPQLGIFNGFGGKGALHIPRAALAFVDQLLLNITSTDQSRLDYLLSK